MGLKENFSDPMDRLTIADGLPKVKKGTQENPLLFILMVEFKKKSHLVFREKFFNLKNKIKIKSIFFRSAFRLNGLYGD